MNPGHVPPPNGRARMPAACAAVQPSDSCGFESPQRHRDTEDGVTFTFTLCLSVSVVPSFCLRRACAALSGLGQNRAQIRHALANRLLRSLLCRLGLRFVRAPQILRAEVAGLLVAVLVALAVTEPFRPGIMCIAQMLRDRQ